MPFEFDRESRLKKIRDMLTRANHPGTPPEEADTARRMAEAMMVKYKIDEAEAIASGRTQESVVDGQDYDFTWWTSSTNKEVTPYLWSMFLELARHCSIKVVYWKPRWASNQIPIVGTAADRAYFDMLFTGVMLEVGKGLEPQPDPNKPMIENLVALKESGQKWERIARQLHSIGQLTDEQYDPGWRQVPSWVEGETREEYGDERAARLKKQVHHLNFSGQYTNYCKKHNRPRLRVTPSIYQRSFAAGFDSRLYERLRDMRDYARRQMESEGNASGMELVLADAMTRANHRAIELYGNPPERKGGGGATRKVAFDNSVIGAGRRAADNVDLSGGKKVTTTYKEIER